MSVTIPVYEHTFGNGLSILKTNAKRVISERNVSTAIELIGTIIAPEKTMPWETGNGIDVDPARSFDLAVAMYYAEHNMHGLQWDPTIYTVAATTGRLTTSATEALAGYSSL
jgi:hypothetical protein